MYDMMNNPNDISYYLIPEDIPSGSEHFSNGKISRSMVGLYSARYFDEPFTVSMMRLNRVCNVIRSKDEDDKKHIDLRFVDNSSVTRTVDAKIPNMHYSYNGGYYDVVTIGKKALYADTDYISVVYGGRINFICLSLLRSLPPFMVKRNDYGYNKMPEDLYRFELSGLYNTSTTYFINLPQYAQNAYNYFISYYNNFSDRLYEYRNNSTGDTFMREASILFDNYRDYLRNIIIEYNNNVKSMIYSVIQPEKPKSVYNVYYSEQDRKIFSEADEVLAAIGL